MKKYNAILILLLTVFTSCDNPTTTKNTTNESFFTLLEMRKFHRDKTSYYRAKV